MREGKPAEFCAKERFLFPVFERLSYPANRNIKLAYVNLLPWIHDVNGKFTGVETELWLAISRYLGLNSVFINGKSYNTIVHMVKF